ncbi:hypothetical protein CASFOL_007071 [Castilleja foliolosa]|uniref:Two-component response regulator n=1 Tax=Castilleja foliolosa TaxID=1961234 RepID=A0ABD3E863_9LAMI
MKFFEKEKYYFPAGRMRVLVVDDDDDDDSTAFKALLLNCQYHVTSVTSGKTALQILRQNKTEFDLVMSEVHLPDMDVFKLLEEVTLRMDIPVVLVSLDDDKEMVRKGVIYGACDYLLKPLRIEEIKIIWQHVVRKKINNNNNKCVGLSGTCSSSEHSRKEEIIIMEELDHHHHHHDEAQDYAVVDEEILAAPKQKKSRVVWLPELHQKFLAAVAQVGLDQAVPKRILEVMNVEGITREHVASHLQKYRMVMKRSDKAKSAQEAKNPILSYNGQLVDERQFISSRQCGSYPPARARASDQQWKWGHYSNNNNNSWVNEPLPLPTNNNNNHYLDRSMMMMMDEWTMPAAFVDEDLSVSFDFGNDNNNNNSNNLMLDADHHIDWSVSVNCHEQQGSDNFDLPTTTSSSAPTQLSSVLISGEFPKTSSSLQVESRSYDDDHHQRL